MAGVAVLNPNDPGLFRAQRGIRGDDPRMMPGAAPGEIRTQITTGETRMAPPASHPPTAAAAFDPQGVGLGVMILLAILLVIHARFTVAATVGTKGS